MKRNLKVTATGLGQSRRADKATLSLPAGGGDSTEISVGNGQQSLAAKANGTVPPNADDITTGKGRAAKAIHRVPAVGDPIASGEGQRPAADKARKDVPPACDTDGEGAGQSVDAEKAIVTLPRPLHSADPRIQEIMGLARVRAFWMRMRLRNTASLAAEIRGLLQPGRGQEETWSEDTKTQALAIVAEAVAHQTRILENAAKEVAGKKPGKLIAEPTHPIGQMPFVRRTSLSLAEWGLEERAVLDRMTAIAQSLPIAHFVEAPERKGFTFAGLAVLIGHAGHPLDYPKKGHLWKRLGLAPYTKDGITRAGSAWGRLGGLSKEDWIELGYKRSRLGDIFGKVTQPLLYAQWRAEGPPLGPYGEAYGTYKARQRELNEAGAFAEEAARQVAAAKKGGRKPQKALLEGKLPDSAINARALRYMTKKLVSDLWSEWRRLGQWRRADKTNENLPTAATLVAEDEAKARMPQSGLMNCASSSAHPVAKKGAKVLMPHRGPHMGAPSSATPIAAG